MSQSENIVWIFDEETYGEVLKHGPHASFVQFNVGGIHHEEWIENTGLMARETPDDDEE